MLFFVFRSELAGSAITTDATGRNLPGEHSPWAFKRRLEVDEGLEPPIGLPVPEMLRRLDRDGFYIVSIRVEME